MYRFSKNAFVHGEGVLAPRQTPKLEDHPLSATSDPFFSIYSQLPSILEAVRSLVRIGQLCSHLQIFMKLYVWVFFENLSGELKFD
jgi:hypothetical protein